MVGAPFKRGFGLSGIPPRWTGSFLSCNGSPGPLSSTPLTVGGRGPWNPTQAKVRLEWGTHHLLPDRERQVCEKCRLGRRAQQQISPGEAEEQIRRPGRQQRGQEVHVAQAL